jgi:hypothetical protein
MNCLSLIISIWACLLAIFKIIAIIVSEFQRVNSAGVGLR